MSELSDKLAGLSPDQIRALAARLRQRKQGDAGGISRLPREQSHFPLSFSQQRLWFLCQLSPHSVAYNNPMAARLKVEEGRNVNPELLDDAFNELIKRHESLRTTFELVDGEPMQRIAPSLHIPLRYVDLDGQPEREQQALAILDDDARQPFDLITGPLLRVTLVRLGPRDYMLLINTHHLISDAWSMGVMLRELMFVVGTRNASLLPALPVQYADFAVWQRKHMQGDTQQRLLDYWTGKLASPLPSLRLPQFRAGRSESVGASYRSRLPIQLARDVAAFAQKHETTPFVVLLAAYKLLLRRYVRQDDIVVGTPVANRMRSEIEALIGCFINTLVLRTDLSDTACFSDAVRRVSDTANGAFAHQEMPFELLVNALQPRRDLHDNPLFQNMFSLQNAPIETSGLGAAVQVIELDNASAKFDLTLTAMELNDEFSLTWTYRADRVERAAIERMAAHYGSLLQAALNSPEVDTVRLPMLDAQERQRIFAYQAEGEVRPDARDYISWFEQASEACLDAPALCQEADCFTYRQLRAASNTLARRLRDAGVSKGDRVALLFDRSPAMIAAMLGTLKAGGAFLPFDPAWPAQRIAQALIIAGSQVVVADPRMMDRLPSATTCVAFDGACWQAGEAGESLAVQVQPSDAAYVIFTSGSSGEPKGVVIEHRHLSRYVENIAARMALPRGARYAMLSTLAADLAYTMLFPALVHGGCLLLASAAQVGEPERLAQWLAQHPADAIKITPSHLDSLLEIDRPERLLPRRLLVLGGEAGSPALLQKLQQLNPGLRVLNHYGPTETTIGVITGDIDLASGCHDERPPLGRPLGDARIYICDEALGVVPIGVPGEICIGGGTVARGYLSREAVASPKFLADPYSAAADARLYRSGDLGRWRNDGQIEFLGRIDNQVKIRGFRVEPAELEAVIYAWPWANAAVVKAVQQAGETKLAAWVTVAEGAEETALHTYLRERLTDAMQPSFVTFISAFPLTANGKIDRNALQLDEYALAAPTGTFIAPRTPMELAVATLWEQLLEVERIGALDSFFDLGGHSLLAVRLAAKVHKAFGISVPLMVLFEHPTVESFARLLSQPERLKGPDTLVPIQPSGNRRPLFFVHPAGGNVLCYYELARELGAEQPFYGLQSSLEDIENAGSMERMAAAYNEAIRQVQPHGPYRLGGWSMGGVVAFELARHLRSQGEQVEWLGILDIPAPGGVKREDRDRIDEATALLIYARKIELFSGVSLDLEQAHEWSADRLSEHLLHAMRAAKLVPEEVRPGMFKRFMEVQRAHNYASLNYVPSTYDGALTVIRCEAPPPIRLEAELLRLDELYAEPSLGWSRFCTQAPIVHRVPGNHVEMMAPPHVKTVADIIQQALA